jgi:hypothetical protein
MDGNLFALLHTARRGGCKRRLPASQRPLVHLLGLDELALVGVEVPEVINCAERRRVLCAERRLPTSQRPLVHLLGQSELTLVIEEIT